MPYHPGDNFSTFQIIVDDGSSHEFDIIEGPLEEDILYACAHVDGGYRTWKKSLKTLKKSKFFDPMDGVGRGKKWRNLYSPVLSKLSYDLPKSPKASQPGTQETSQLFSQESPENEANEVTNLTEIDVDELIEEQLKLCDRDPNLLKTVSEIQELCAEVSQLREESTKLLQKMLVASLAAKKATNSIVHPAVAAAHDYILGEKTSDLNSWYGLPDVSPDE